MTFRADAETTRLIEQLAVEGESRSDTIRRALHDAARLHRREQMRREAQECLESEEDRAEAVAVLADLEPLRAW